jgi:hypothetical protein
VLESYGSSAPTVQPDPSMSAGGQFSAPMGVIIPKKWAELT